MNNTQHNVFHLIGMLLRTNSNSNSNCATTFTPDVFEKLLDDKGNFKDSLITDVEGLLSLYEASNYGINGEEIMDKALEFSSSHLEGSIHKMPTSLSRRVKEALDMPISKTLTRLGARKFISLYQEDESHNELLLNFAKLDFNIVQKMHQRELHHITRLAVTPPVPFKTIRIYYSILTYIQETCY